MRSLKLLLFAPLLAACGANEMADGSRLKPLEGSAFFADGRSARPRVEGTVAQGQLDDGSPRNTGLEDGRFLADIPGPVTAERLALGRARFDAVCSVCHGRTGRGDGMVVERGFPRPPSFHEERLRRAPAGELFAVQTKGFGRMYAYADKLTVEERWAVTAYIRALQLAAHAPVARLEPAERRRLEALR